jgi:catechol 2,3-dioxygenase-like lactoylglutathione lyase family enzyme
MKAKISIVTLGVEDMDRAVKFYRDGLGFPTHNEAEGDAFVMFKLEGSWLALHPRAMMGAPVGRGSPGMALSHNEPSSAAVDEVYAEALRAGATPIVPPRNAEWGGYEAGFADPDGHVWDIAYNPFTDLT